MNLRMVMIQREIIQGHLINLKQKGSVMIVTFISVFPIKLLIGYIDGQ